MPDGPKDASADREWTRLDEKVERYFEILRDDLKKTESILDERLARLRESDQRTSDVLNERLSHMNEFRAQIQQERGMYATNDKIAMLMNPVEDRVRSLETWQAKVVGALILVGAIGIANFVRIWVMPVAP